MSEQDDTLRAQLTAWREPYIGKTLGELGAIKALERSASGLRWQLAL